MEEIDFGKQLIPLLEPIIAQSLDMIEKIMETGEDFSRDEVSIYEMRRIVKATLNAYIIEERKDAAIDDLKRWWEKFKDHMERPSIIFNPDEMILSKTK
jgi:hypothetical protein